MKNIINYVWNDPVWSKVIASAMISIIGLLFLSSWFNLVTLSIISIIILSSLLIYIVLKNKNSKLTSKQREKLTQLLSELTNVDIDYTSWKTKLILEVKNIFKNKKQGEIYLSEINKLSCGVGVNEKINIGNNYKKLGKTIINNILDESN